MEKTKRYAIVHFENGTTNTLAFPVKDEEEAKEKAIKGLLECTGLTREQLVKVTKVEWVKF